MSLDDVERAWFLSPECRRSERFGFMKAALTGLLASSEAEHATCEDYAKCAGHHADACLAALDAETPQRGVVFGGVTSEMFNAEVERKVAARLRETPPSTPASVSAVDRELAEEVEHFDKQVFTNEHAFNFARERIVNIARRFTEQFKAAKLRADGGGERAPVTRCEHCGSHDVVKNLPGCYRCGAPQCCQQCCRITTLELEIEQLRAAPAAAPAPSESSPVGKWMYLNADLKGDECLLVWDFDGQLISDHDLKVWCRRNIKDCPYIDMIRKGNSDAFKAELQRRRAAHSARESTNITQAARDVVLEAPEGELREIVGEREFDELAQRGRDAMHRALGGVPKPFTDHGTNETELVPRIACDHKQPDEHDPHCGEPASKQLTLSDAVKCGCGKGELTLDGGEWKWVCCGGCGIESSAFDSEHAAVLAWNTAMRGAREGLSEAESAWLDWSTLIPGLNTEIEDNLAAELRSRRSGVRPWHAEHDEKTWVAAMAIAEYENGRVNLAHFAAHPVMAFRSALAAEKAPAAGEAGK